MENIVYKNYKAVSYESPADSRSFVCVAQKWKTLKRVTHWTTWTSCLCLWHGKHLQNSQLYEWPCSVLREKTNRCQPIRGTSPPAAPQRLWCLKSRPQSKSHKAVVQVAAAAQEWMKWEHSTDASTLAADLAAAILCWCLLEINATGLQYAPHPPPPLRLSFHPPSLHVKDARIIALLAYLPRWCMTPIASQTRQYL